MKLIEIQQISFDALCKISYNINYSENQVFIVVQCNSHLFLWELHNILVKI